MKELSGEQRVSLDEHLRQYEKGTEDLHEVVEVIERFARCQYDTTPYWSRLNESIQKRMFGRYPGHNVVLPNNSPGMTQEQADQLFKQGEH